MRSEINLLGLIWEVEFPDELGIDDNVENERGPNWKVAKEVKAAINKEVRQTPQRNPTTQIWHGNELPICKAFCETTLSIDFWFCASISLFFTNYNECFTQKASQPFSSCDWHLELPILLTRESPVIHKHKDSTCESSNYNITHNYMWATTLQLWNKCQFSIRIYQSYTEWGRDRKRNLHQQPRNAL